MHHHHYSLVTEPLLSSHTVPCSCPQYALQTSISLDYGKVLSLFEDSSQEITHPTFQQACLALEIFAQEDEAHHCIVEAITSLCTPRQIRVLFAHLLTNECINGPRQLWDRFHLDLCKDFWVDNGGDLPDALNSGLNDIGQLLEEFGKTLDDFGLPQPMSHADEVSHELSRWNAQSPYLLRRSIEAFSHFTSEQHRISSLIVHAIHHRQPLCLFVDGKAGRGKTFLVNALCDWVRANGKIVLATATSAFAAQLYPGGRTTHSTFKVNGCWLI